jgi:tRNA threonylcarbamoyladenosine biosynthesis protein TsaB
MRRLAKIAFTFGIKIALWSGNGTSPFDRTLIASTLDSAFAYTFQMHFIVLDTADARGSVAVFRDQHALAIESHMQEEDYSSWVLPAVQRVLASSSLTLSQLDGYAVCAGPGSFTGLRIGLTTVKAWAEIYRRPIAAVSRLEALTVHESASRDNYLAALIDARRDQVFAALYKRSNGSFALSGEESVTSLPDFVARVARETAGQPALWRTPDVQVVESLPQWQALGALGHTIEKVGAPFATYLGQIAFCRFEDGKTTDALSLDANYVRRSDAEIFWKGNKSAFRP